MEKQQEHVTEYIKTHLDLGYTKQHLREHMLRHGWLQEQVETAFTEHARVYESTQTDEAHTTRGQIVAAEPPMQNVYIPESVAPDPPPKYKVFRAMVDVASALRHNWTTLGLFGILAAVVSLAVSVILTLVVLHVVDVLFGQGFSSGRGVLIALGLVQLLVMLLIVLVATFITNAISHLVQKGTLLEKTGLRVTLQRAVHLLPHTFRINLLLALIILVPYVLAFIVLPAIFLVNVHTNTIVGIIPATLVGTLVYEIIVLLRFSLAPFIAFYDPERKHVFAHSKHLLQKGGQWFIFKLTLLGIFGAIVLKLLERADLGWIGNIIDVVCSVILCSALAQLYLNRVTVRR